MLILTLKDGKKPDRKILEAVETELKKQNITTGKKKIINYIFKDDSDHASIEETLIFEDTATGKQYKFYTEWGQLKYLKVI